MIIDTEYNVDNQELTISHTNNNGKRELKTFPFSPYQWVEVSSNARKYDKNKTTVKGTKVRKQDDFYPKKHAINEFLFLEAKKAYPDIFNPTPPLMYFADIEVLSDDGFPEPKDANAPVVTIALSSPTGDVRLFTLKELTNQQISSIQNNLDNYFADFDVDINLSYKCFKNEYTLLKSFLSVLSKLPLITGWNFVEFDWAYIYNRAKTLGIDPSIASPTNNLSYAGRNKIYKFPSHCGIVDYQKAWAKYDFSTKVKENEKLDWVSDTVLGVKKINYKGSLSDLYKQDFEKYCYYNIVDTILVKLIHDETNSLNVQLNFAFIGETQLSNIDSPVALTECLLQEDLYHDEDIVFAKMQEKPQNASYDGAFVMEPVKGLHKAMASWDFSSLYPTLMRMFNISVESYIGKLDPDTQVIHSHIAENNNIKFDLETMIQTKTNAVYSRDESILKKKLTQLYNKRIEYKEKMFKAAHILHKLKQHQSSTV